MSIEDKIRDFILKNLYFVEDQGLGDDVSFLAEGVIDSMGAMELVAFVETEFAIKVEMSEVVVRNFDSIRQLADFIRRKLASANRSSIASIASESQPVGKNIDSR
jgi:acyl carrier protein